MKTVMILMAVALEDGECVGMTTTAYEGEVADKNGMHLVEWFAPHVEADHRLPTYDEELAAGELLVDMAKAGKETPELVDE